MAKIEKLASEIIIGDGKTYWQANDDRYISVKFPSMTNAIWIKKDELHALRHKLIEELLMQIEIELSTPSEKAKS
jgi:hypothetical protein